MAIGTPTDLGHFQGTSTPASGSITTTAAVSSGDLIVLVRYSNASTGTMSTPTDSSSNTYVQAGSAFRVTTTAPVCDIWYCANAASMASSSTISLTFGGSALREAVTAFKVSGMATSGNIIDPYCVTTVNGTSSTATSATSLNIRNLYTESLLLGMLTTAVNITSPSFTGYTQVGGMITGSANILPCYQIVTTASAGTAWAPSWTGSALYRSYGLAFVGANGKLALGGGSTLLGVGA